VVAKLFHAVVALILCVLIYDRCLSAWRTLVHRSALLLHYCSHRKVQTLKTCLQQWRRSLQLHGLQKEFLIHQFHTRQKNTGLTILQVAYHYIYFKSLRLVRFEKKNILCSPWLHLFDKNTVNCNIVIYYYNLK